MIKHSAVHHAIGALKLVRLHIDHPTVISSELLGSAASEAVERLIARNPHMADLGELYASLLAVTPLGHLPHVTLTRDAKTPYGAVVTDSHGNVVARQIGKTIEGLTQLIALQFGREPQA